MSKNNITSDFDVAYKVLTLGASSLLFMANNLDNSFTTALDILQSVKGRVIVSGMGKSGHVARKVSATLASTGTPSQFIHPAEASHGDLGMITVSDACLLFSNSGETVELNSIINHARSFNIPLVCVTKNSESYLSRSSDVSLLIPDIPEGCSNGMAPTTSTLASMALGDALAIALMERKQFSMNDFKMLHPGGKLGNG